MRSRRRLAVVPVLLLALVACSDDTSAPEDDASFPPITGEGRGGSELPAPEDQAAALESSGAVVEVFSGALAEGETGSGQVADVAAGTQLLRVVCTSQDGAPVTVTVTAGDDEVTSYPAPCAPVFQGGATMSDSDAFDVPGGALDVTVTANTGSVAAVGLIAG